ncbi:hypothetical protein C8Q80DRAFT_821682 [Daedaleopsis nitida]|nr:hypothetical protein C8Q80DRAFT_821682 [Daedaleopsis nitida]
MARLPPSRRWRCMKNLVVSKPQATGTSHAFQIGGTMRSSYRTAAGRGDRTVCAATPASKPGMGLGRGMGRIRKSEVGRGRRRLHTARADRVPRQLQPPHDGEQTMPKREMCRRRRRRRRRWSIGPQLQATAASAQPSTDSSNPCTARGVRRTPWTARVDTERRVNHTDPGRRALSWAGCDLGMSVRGNDTASGRALRTSHRSVRARTIASPIAARTRCGGSTVVGCGRGGRYGEGDRQ